MQSICMFCRDWIRAKKMLRFLKRIIYFLLKIYMVKISFLIIMYHKVKINFVECVRIMQHQQKRAVFSYLKTQKATSFCLQETQLYSLS